MTVSMSRYNFTYYTNVGLQCTYSGSTQNFAVVSLPSLHSGQCAQNAHCFFPAITDSRHSLLHHYAPASRYHCQTTTFGNTFCEHKYQAVADLIAFKNISEYFETVSDTRLSNYQVIIRDAKDNILVQVKEGLVNTLPDQFNVDY